MSFQYHVSLTLWIILLDFKHVCLTLHISLSCLEFVFITVKVMGLGFRVHHGLHYMYLYFIKQLGHEICQ
jgi:hypothetical protein